MNISKELLEHIGLISTVLKNKPDQIVQIEKKNNKDWYIHIANNIYLDELLAIQFTFKKGIEIVKAKVNSSGEDWLIVEFITVDNTLFCDMVNKIEQLETKEKLFGRRKEERFEIGICNSKKFGLNEPEQKIYTSNTSTQACAIVDVSLHGICIITQNTLSIQNINNFYIKINFIEPETNILMQLHKVHSRIDKIGEKSYVRLSCQILEPIHFQWKDRIYNLYK